MAQLWACLGRVGWAAAFVWLIAGGCEELASLSLGCTGPAAHERCVSSRHPLTAEGAVLC